MSKAGGLGGLEFPLLADFQKKISEDYGVLLKDAGVALRWVWLNANAYLYFRLWLVS